MTPKSLIEPARHAGTALLRSQTDARLIDLTRDGNERAFEAIVQRYRRALLLYCSRLLPAARAEDAVQQAFLSAHRAIHAGNAELNLRPWLYRIAHNASLNLLRQQGFDHEQVSEEIDGVETPPQAFERGERLRTVVAAVQELPDRQRSAIVLQALEGRSYDEIAAELGVSDGAVRQLLNRARNTLREAAAAITPTGLITRIASSGGDVTVAERVAQVVTGAGGGALLAKAGATLAVVGAVAGGAATGTLPGTGHHRHSRDSSGAVAKASAAQQASLGGGGAASLPGTSGAHRANVVLTSGGGAAQATHGTVTSRTGGGNGNHGHSGSQQGGGSGGPGSPSDGSHHGGGSSDHSGSGSSGSSDHSGSGSSGSSDHSGSGDSSPSDHSGSGDSSPSDHSGSGSSGSGKSPDDPAAPAPAPAPSTTPSSGHDRQAEPSEPPDPPEPPDDSGKGISH